MNAPISKQAIEIARINIPILIWDCLKKLSVWLNPMFGNYILDALRVNGKDFCSWLTNLQKKNRIAWTKSTLETCDRSNIENWRGQNCQTGGGI